MKNFYSDIEPLTTDEKAAVDEMYFDEDNVKETYGLKATTGYKSPREELVNGTT